MPLQKKCLLIIMLIFSTILCACARVQDKKENCLEKEAQEREEAEEDCIRMAKAVFDVYTLSDGFSDETIEMMQEKAGEKGRL